jgi:phenylacetate-CoA ligase
VTLRKSAEGMAHELAATWRGYSWAGIDIGDKQARFWGVPHDKKDRLRARLIDLVTNRLRLSAFAFSESDFEMYISKLQDFKPTYFYGYVSMIRQLAEYVERNKLVVDFQPMAIITTAEVLNQADRDIIERVFKCKVYNEYGCGEVGTIAHECSSGSLHLTSENIILEVVDENGNSVPPGKQGEIVVTDLVNYSMPLIRYKLKDYGEVDIKACDCGVKLPCLKKIYGREYDYLVNSRGEKFHGEFFLYMVEDIKKTGFFFRGVQFVQSPDLSIVVNLVGDTFDIQTLSDYFKNAITEKMKDNIDVSVDFVKEIKRESSGKLRVVKRLNY